MLFAALCVAAALVVSVSACNSSVSCSCGTSNKTFTYCTDGLTSQGDPCERLSNCATCNEEFFECATCPPGLSGVYCTTGNCPTLQGPVSGSIVCQHSGNYGECKGRCIPGYTFEDDEDETEILLQCHRGSWYPRRSFPPCKSGNHCRLDGQGNSYFNCTAGMDGTKCDIWCDNRYAGRFHCYPGREWRPSLPHCTIPKVPTSTKKRLCGCRNGGTCNNYGACECPDGWSGQYCEHENRISCVDPGIPRGSNRMNSNGAPESYERNFEEGESLIFSCKGENMVLAGKALIYCERNGGWSAPLPQCRSRVPSITCKDPGQVSYADRMNVDGSSFGSTQTYAPGKSVIYNCRPGYALHGNSMLTCLQTGFWSVNKPKCVISPITDTTGYPCTHPGVDVNGYIRDSLYDFRGRSEFRFAPGTQLTYSCKDGFILRGEAIIFCLSTGRWNEPRPTCEATKQTEAPPLPSLCEYHGDISNSQVTPKLMGNWVQEGTQVKHVCNPGYKLQGPSILFCQPNGQWSNLFPECIPDTVNPVPGIFCPFPKVDENGDIDDSLIDQRSHNKVKFDPGQELRFTCNDGFELQGRSIIYCRNTGMWSDESPSCIHSGPREKMDCLKPDSITNGHLVIHRNTFLDQETSSRANANPENSAYPVGTKLEYLCEFGYVLKGNKTLFCEPNGFWTYEFPTCVEDCGLTMFGAKVRVTGGNVTEAGEWPWVVAVLEPRGSARNMVCGGALLDKRTVLTAAHCFNNKAPYYVFEFGKLRRKDSREMGVEVRRSSEIIIHPEFNATTYANDIALIRLDSEITKYTPKILSVCLPTPESTSANLVEGKDGTVTGWGITEKQLTAEVLMKALLPVQSNDRCKRAYRNLNLSLEIGPGMFCAGHTNGVVSACRGDSGSPFVFYNNTSNRYTMEGCVSFSAAGQCGMRERYTVFTKISYYMDWIEANRPR